MLIDKLIKLLMKNKAYRRYNHLCNLYIWGIDDSKPRYSNGRFAKAFNIKNLLGD